MRMQVRCHASLPPSHFLHARCLDFVATAALDELGTVDALSPELLEEMVRGGVVSTAADLQWVAAAAFHELVLWRERSKALAPSRVAPTWRPGGELRDGPPAMPAGAPPSLAQAEKPPQQLHAEGGVPSPQAGEQPPGAAAAGRAPSPQERVAHVTGRVWGAAAGVGTGGATPPPPSPCWENYKEALFGGMYLVDAGAHAQAAPILHRYHRIIMDIGGLLPDDGDGQALLDVLRRFPVAEPKP